MRASLIVFLLLFSSLSLAKDKKKEGTPECVDVSHQAIYQGVGYTHFVRVKNNCKKEVRCEIASTVDPEPKTNKRIAPGESVEVVTRRSSPASGFAALVSCEEKKK